MITKGSFSHCYEHNGRRFKDGDIVRIWCDNISGGDWNKNDLVKIIGPSKIYNPHHVCIAGKI